MLGLLAERSGVEAGRDGRDGPLAIRFRLPRSQDRTTSLYHVSQQPGPGTCTVSVALELILKPRYSIPPVVAICARRKPQPGTPRPSITCLPLCYDTAAQGTLSIHAPPISVSAEVTTHVACQLTFSLATADTWPHPPSIGPAGSLLSRNRQSA